MGIVTRRTSVLGEVFAPWWRWPLQSPRRLVTVTVLVIGVLVGIARFAAARTDPPAPPPPATTTTSSTPTSAPATTAATRSPYPSSSSSASSGSGSGAVEVVVPVRAREVAGEFVRLWARPGIPQRRWYAELSAYASVHLAGPLSYSDPRLVPATRVTAAPQAVEMSPDGRHPTSVTFLVGTDAGAVRVSVDLIRSRWLVTAFESADTFRETD